MGDIKKRMASVVARRWKNGDAYFDRDAHEALGRAQEYFGTKDANVLSLLMAETLFGRQERGRAKGVKTWTDHRHLMLAFAYYDMKREHPSMSDTKIAAALCKDPVFRSDAESLRQRLREAKRQYDEWGKHQAEEAFADYYSASEEEEIITDDDL
jgi:hypothetical protein